MTLNFAEQLETKLNLNLNLGCYNRIELLLPRSQHGVQATTLIAPYRNTLSRIRTALPVVELNHRLRRAYRPDT